ncbi:MAG: hypothetical protein MOB07_07060 [Acidobacteria bacterium]|nr:hypothetical protein [Acidobacteriota bacterium]
MQIYSNAAGKPLDGPELESLDDILAAAQAGRVLIQNFVPLAESLDWELGRLYWKRH